MYEFLLVFGVVLWVVVAAFYMRQPAASAFHPASFYLLVHGVIFVIRPLLAYHYDFNGIYRLYDFMPTMEEKCIVLAGADLGFVTFVAASLYIGRMPIDFSRTVETARTQGAVQRAFLIAALICGPIALYSLYVMASGTGAEMELDAATGTRYNVNGNGYFADAGLMVGPLCVLAAWLFRFRLPALIPFFLFVVLRLSTGQRGPMVVACASLGLFYLFQQRHRWPTPRIVAMMVVVLGLFTVVGANRSAFRDYLKGSETTIDTSNVFNERPLESMDYGNMEFFEYLVHVIPNRTGTYGYFLDNLQVFTEPVPRVIWRSKPIGAPIQLFSLFDYGTPIGMTSSVPGEGWAQAGFAGIVIWSALFGACYGWIYRAFARSRKSWFHVALYLIFIPGAIVTLRDGVLLTVLKASAFYVLPVLVTWFVARYVIGSVQASRTGSVKARSKYHY